ncbi:ATP-binding protein [Streptomyces iranensis]|uniref:AbaA-like regulatory protein n=1 Tax=Streptomyces iranensis TaxID=576784 RepID=A0A060ZVK0_9ACTN|nr:ATP-binding protein [Streptomyces iranensis]MBP2065204.1 anti-sigma regulatory factor (Ser/Thr protein kinase) [Streptomyces iranensis]CDR09841.1 AbaA-like regulatory protein [Streptomyces iranensis]
MPVQPSNGTRPAATGHPAYSQSLPCEAESAIRARRLVRAACTAWGLAPLAEAGALIASELVANSVAHSGSRCLRVTVSRPDARWVRVAVIDKSRAQPVQRTANADDESGRGLAIVEAISVRWGTDRLPWGKRVWADLRAPREEK